MTTGDRQVERLADKLQELADRSAAEGGAKAKLAQPLADDAAFVRKLKPSLIKARAKGEAPRNLRPDQGVVAPTGPQLAARPNPKVKHRGGGPNPWVVLGVCLAAGIVLAKWIDWRGHAHPRD
jgi:hypothetical protein